MIELKQPQPGQWLWRLVAIAAFAMGCLGAFVVLRVLTGD